MNRALAVAFLLIPAAANAQRQNVKVEVGQGPIIAPSSMVGMGGAGLALNEGADNVGANPAAVASRGRAQRDRFNGDFTLAFGRGYAGSDFDNDGRGGEIAAVASLGVAGLFARNGWGIHHAYERIRDSHGGSGQPGDNRIEYDTQVTTLAGGYSFFDGDIAIGAAALYLDARYVDIEYDFPNPDIVHGDLRLVGWGGSGGVVYRPRGQPFRVAASFRSAIRAEETAGSEGGSRHHDLDGVESPWQAGAGFAWSFGPRPLNTIGWTKEAGAAPDETRERYLLVAVDVVVVGRTGKSVPFRTLEDGVIRRVGGKPTTSLRAGVETEPFPNRLRLRAGSYWEPSRFADRDGRIHGTFSAEVRLFKLWFDWMASASGDIAPGYQNVGASIGVWY